MKYVVQVGCLKLNFYYATKLKNIKKIIQVYSTFFFFLHQGKDLLDELYYSTTNLYN